MILYFYSLGDADKGRHFFGINGHALIYCGESPIHGFVFVGQLISSLQLFCGDVPPCLLFLRILPVIAGD